MRTYAAEASRLFQALDTNHNGELSRNEARSLKGVTQDQFEGVLRRRKVSCETIKDTNDCITNADHTDDGALERIGNFFGAVGSALAGCVLAPFSLVGAIAIAVTCEGDYAQAAKPFWFFKKADQMSSAAFTKSVDVETQEEAKEQFLRKA